MKLNNTFLAVFLSVLGLFLTIVSLRLSGVIQENNSCIQQHTLHNANRGILIIGLILFMSSGGYLLCKRNCSGDLSVASSTSDVMYFSFNLVLGIIIIVLFSIVSSELNKCNTSLKKTDSSLILAGLLVGICATVLSLGFLGKKLYDNRANASSNLAQMKESASNRFAQMKESASSNLAQMKNSASSNLAQMKESASSNLAQMKNSASSNLAQMKNSASNNLAQMKESAMSKAQNAANSITSSPYRNKNVDINLPDINSLPPLPSDYTPGLNVGNPSNGPSRYIDPFGLDISHSRGDNPVRNNVPYVDPFGYDN
jgi:F0F1-type ATP synthase membrane subunit b/b'